MRKTLTALVLAAVTTLTSGQTTRSTTQPTTQPTRMTAKQASEYVATLPHNLRELLTQGESERQDVLFVGGLDSKMLAELKSRKTFYPPKLRLLDGRIGRFRGMHVEVSQVIDDGNAIAYSVTNYGQDREYFWLHGFATQGIADGQHISPDGLWRVDGTKSFISPQGAKRTLVLVKPFEMPLIWSADVGKAVAKTVSDERKRRYSR